MTQLKLLGSSAIINCLKATTEIKCCAIVAQQQLQQQRQRGYGTTPNPAEGRPLKEMPTAKKLTALWNFRPGGKYDGADLNDISKGLLKDANSDIVMLSGLFGKPPIVLTQNPDDFETVFRHDGAYPYRKGFELLNYYRTVYRKDYFGEEPGLITSQNEEWGKMRSAVNPIIIHPKNVKLYLGALDKINQQFIDRIKQIRDAETNEVPKNFKDEISAWTLESVGMVALDRQLGLIDNSNPRGRHFFTLLRRFFDLAVDLEIKPSLWRQFKTRKLKEVLSILDEAIDITDGYVQEAIDRIEKDKNVKSDAEKSVLEKLLAINRKYAVVMAMDMLFAGVDTTTSTFAAILLALAQHPEKQAKLRAEIRGILPEKDTPLTVESMKNLPYLRACIKESLRYYPLTSANVRTTRQELVLSGFRVPKGSEVAMVHLNLWRNPKHFSQADEFIPERWLRESQTEKESGCPVATKSSHPFAYLPFGFGARSCIGRRIAEMELEVGVARLLRHFEVEFNHPADKPFIAYQLSTPRIPLQFKFTDLKD
ncbi:cytochrome P450 CYP12A2-like isoform X1 [Drosophila sulfurigaster albostrigata]|uniref:cytochrome P450 CYP12A2-like isoform X1 n=1 Tax=Drosophila sulfurigaster albostrigata TaxID=89887 RepID=UPI002D21E202|nr:cytochrome P450 CYP12A2-like isoform X1 [Drosophila sulfurigaster albostrigata]